ncbi:hypothetical protein EGW08_005092, partial [Elysia chlorotica]
FPYGLSGVQMPTYNFGSELYNYVSNGFPRKSRMCTFCNKVFTRSTTRRYHERRCPLLRASNSLAKSEENSVAAAAALKEQQQQQQQQHQQQQRHKEAASRISGPLASPSAGSRGLNGLVHSSNREREKDRDSSHLLNGSLGGMLGGRHTPPQLRQASPGRQDKIPTSNISGARLKAISPPLSSWGNKAPYEDPECKTQKEPPPFMAVRPLDEDEEEEEDDEEDEEEMEEDEEQFNETASAGSREESLMDKPGKNLMDFRGVSGRRNHARSSSYNPLVCNICKKSFSDTLARQTHEALHSQTKSFACALCSRSFHCAYSLRIHFLRHHSNGGPYPCKYCPSKYDSVLALKAHLVTQHVLTKQEASSLKYFSLLEEPTGSPRSSSSGGRLSIGSHRSALSDTERDSKSRSRVLSLTNGEVGTSSATHDTGNKASKEEETEVCKVCNKSFAKSFIRYHERAHADQKPYECSICHKRFGYKNNMKSHMKLHQGLKPYQCQICGARFTRGSTLRRHGRRHNISRNSMLEYVLYDHSAGPTRAVGVTSKTGSATSTPSAVAAAAASHHAAAVASSLYAQQMASKMSPSDPALMTAGSAANAQLGFNPALSRQNSDFAAQVNFCCPSPLVQSSTGHTHLHRSSSNTGSPPVGSTSSSTSPPANSTTTAAGSTTENVTARASPSGHVSHPNSPDNTTTTTASPIPSPTAESDVSLHGDGVDGGHDDGSDKLSHKKSLASLNSLNNPLHELLLSLITSGRMFRCSFCEIYFAEYAMFRLHQKYHQCDHDRPFVCSVCGEDCKDKTYFTVHLAEHLG